MKNLKSVLAVVMALIIGVCLTGCKSDDYKAAVALYDSGDYSAAVSAFAALGDYKDSADRAAEAQQANDYEAAAALYDSGDYAAAVSAFAALGDYKDSADRALKIQQAENAEFTKWFSDVSIQSYEMGRIALILKFTDNGLENIGSENIGTIENATLTIGEKEYFSNDSSYDGITFSGDISFDTIARTLPIKFSGVTSKEYDSLTVTIKDQNDAEVTLTFYPNVK
jgi:hypothetical protein